MHNILPSNDIVLHNELEPKDNNKICDLEAQILLFFAAAVTTSLHPLDQQGTHLSFDRDSQNNRFHRTTLTVRTSLCLFHTRTALTHFVLQ